MGKFYNVAIEGLIKENVTIMAETKEEAETLAKKMLEDMGVAIKASSFVSGPEFTAENTINVLVVEPGRKPYMANIGTSLSGMQKVVGGYIEIVSPFKEDVLLVCNEEGKLRGLAPNRSIYSENGRLVDIIVGTFFICGACGDELASLPEEMQSVFTERFKVPEKF